MLDPDPEIGIRQRALGSDPIGMIHPTYMYRPDSSIMRLLVYVLCAGVRIIKLMQRDGLDNSHRAYQVSDPRYTHAFPHPTPECMNLHGRHISRSRRFFDLHVNAFCRSSTIHTEGGDESAPPSADAWVGVLAGVWACARGWMMAPALLACQSAQRWAVPLVSRSELPTAEPTGGTSD